MDSVGLEAMEVVVVGAQTPAELAINGALCVVTPMLGVWDVAETITSRPQDRSGEKDYLPRDLTLSITRECVSIVEAHTGQTARLKEP